MMYSEIYAKRIRSLCRQRNMSIYQLSQLSGVNQSTLSNILNGHSKNQQAITIHKIALGFSMTLAEFVNFKELNDYSFDD